jgi:hypothetical protein
MFSVNNFYIRIYDCFYNNSNLLIFMFIISFKHINCIHSGSLKNASLKTIAINKGIRMARLAKQRFALFSLSVVLLLPYLAAASEQSPALRQLLKNRNPALLTEWANRYEHGEGVEQNYHNAITLYCTAARRGYTLAQYQLGWLYANGRGVDQNDELAAAWFQQAAQKGDADAKRMLSLLGNPKTSKRVSCVLPGDVSPKWTGISSAQRKQIIGWVKELAPGYGLDPNLVLAVILVESGFNAGARSPKNAQGLMQLIPATAERFGVKNVLDPIQNLRGGMAYLRWLLIYFEGNLRFALAGYNAGENAVDKYQGIPPYSETQAYVAAVIRHYGSEQHPPMAQVTERPAMLAATGTAPVR